MSVLSFAKSTKQNVLCKTRDTYNRINRHRLKNTTPTIITRNCMAGIIYHNLGLKFNSPTINLSMDNPDYIRFLENFNEFLTVTPIQIYPDNNPEYPVGELRFNGISVQINFVHYKTFEEAVQKWEQRKKRINPDNIYIIWEVANEYGPSIELYKRFCELNFKNKILITGKKFPADAKNVVKMKIYNSKYYYGKILEYRRFPFGYKRYLDKFNYVNYLNQP